MYERVLKQYSTSWQHYGQERAVMQWYRFPQLLDYN